MTSRKTIPFRLAESLRNKTRETCSPSVYSMLSVSLCLCGLLGVVLPAFAEFAKTEWQFSKHVEATSTSSDGYARVAVDGQVYHRSQRSLADLRLVDDLGKEVPYSIFAERETTTEELYQPKVFNQGVLPGAYSTLTLDLEQEMASNTLVLKTSSQNFKRRVEIAGSSDRKQWFVLKADGYIFDFSGDQKIHLTTIRYPESKYRYLQVKVWNGKEPPLTIKGASLSRVRTTTARRVVRGVRLHSRDEDAKLKATICVLDLSYENLPADYLTIETPEENFSRLIEIQGSNDLKSWGSSQRGDLYRFRTEKYSVEKKTLRFPEIRTRYLKLLIYNQDDPPLKLAAFDVQSVEEDLVYRVQPGRSYFFYYGSPQAQAPRYDFERLKNYLSLETLPRGRLGAEIENSSFRPSGPKRPWTERQPVLFWGVLILMVFGLGAYIVRLMMKVKTA
ncbi:MAG: DUF3999 domain-containing protein [Acidobacteria bacterium]|nr:DUF3999 domain-containing protein [Acidobacteriota bacterium]MCI0621769.1 DUF3999 domain-containing protein [Acidobacteriota bacterium]MCI0718667.1 DUF3999 domain-containing protein [Acidobacteriota bacterium]